MNVGSLVVSLFGLQQFFANALPEESALQATTSPTDSKNILDYLTPQQRKWWLTSIAKYDHKIPKQLSGAQKQQITIAINRARSNVNPTASAMKEVRWNPELQAALVKYRNDNNGSIFFTLNHPFPKEYPELNVDFLGDHLMELPEFAKFRKFCRMWWHDTNAKIEGRVLRVTNMRIRQGGCFDLNRCSPVAFNYFYSCLKANDQGAVAKKCELANRYYVDFTDEQYDSFAGVLLGIGGPFTPSGQADAHWFFACNSAGLRKYVNDIPYKAGPSASKCPDEAPLKKSKLCVSLT
jgi:hypothetical protein